MNNEIKWVESQKWWRIISAEQFNAFHTENEQVMCYQQCYQLSVSGKYIQFMPSDIEEDKFLHR